MLSKVVTFILAGFPFLVLAKDDVSMHGDDCSSFHVNAHTGYHYPNGIDMLGITLENPITRHVYSYYTVGLVSIVAGGLGYYQNYHGNGLAIIAGTGLFAPLHGSVAYKMKIADQQYLTMGAGYGRFFEGQGYYPVVAYEYRFR